MKTELIGLEVFNARCNGLFLSLISYQIQSGAFFLSCLNSFHCQIKKKQSTFKFLHFQINDEHSRFMASALCSFYVVVLKLSMLLNLCSFHGFFKHLSDIFKRCTSEPVSIHRIEFRHIILLMSRLSLTSLDSIT